MHEMGDCACAFTPLSCDYCGQVALRLTAAVILCRLRGCIVDCYADTDNAGIATSAIGGLPTIVTMTCVACILREHGVSIKGMAHDNARCRARQPRNNLQLEEGFFSAFGRVIFGIDGLPARDEQTRVIRAAVQDSPHYVALVHSLHMTVHEADVRAVAMAKLH